jgi:regulator of sigma E protease
LVLVHEFGHYLAAVKTGVLVEEFGLGLPPRIVGKKIGKTVFSLNWLPIGGFCRLYGEDDDKKEKNAFNNKNPWQKGIIVLGGVLMNLALAVVIFSVVYSILGVPKETDKVKIIGIGENTPAEIAGLKEGDVVVAVGERPVTKSAELIEEVGKYKGRSVKLRVTSYESNLTKEIEVEVRENPPAGEGAMGVAVSNTELVKLPWYRSYEGIGAGFKEAYYWGRIIFGGVTKVIGGLLTGEVPKDVAGPIGMFQATSSIKQNQGMLAVVHFFGIVSVNLAIVNILPFPALDGGRILFVIYELVTKRRVNQKFEAIVNNAGMAILLGLLLMITVGDVTRLVK